MWLDMDDEAFVYSWSRWQKWISCGESLRARRKAISYRRWGKESHWPPERSSKAWVSFQSDMIRLFVEFQLYSKYWVISSVYIRHQYFIDFAEHKQKRPLYINVIRDPVEKFRSFYYFIRNGNLEGDGGDVPMSESKRLMNINDCVSRRVSVDWPSVIDVAGFNCENRLSNYPNLVVVHMNIDLSVILNLEKLQIISVNSGERMHGAKMADGSLLLRSRSSLPST